VRPAKPAAYGWLWAAGELAMSASDLAKWDIARIDRNVLPADDWVAQETEIKLADGKGTHYGLGVSVGDHNGMPTVSHGGEAVGFLSENVVIRDKRFAVVALVNADFGRAQDAITDGVIDLFYPVATPPAALTEDQVRDDLAARLYDQLRAGTLDRSLLTEDANYYFDAIAVADYRDSLGPLGKPDAIKPLGKARLRGGFVNRNYAIVFGKKRLLAITYAEPGVAGKFEQFIVMPLD
jgi:hypothetical protein